MISLVGSLSTWARLHRLRFGAAILALLAVQSAAAYSRLTSTTAVESGDALAEFRARQASFPPPDAAPSPGVPFESGASPAPPPAPGAAPGPAAGKASAASPAPQACDWACPSAFTPPERGVYSWFQCGKSSGQCSGAAGEPEATESVGGIPRTFPSEGTRTIIVTGASTWNNVHDYAEQHREEFDLTVDPSGVYNHRYKVDLTIAGRKESTDIRQVPPLRFAQWPMALGLAWTGEWKDPNGNSDARYECRVAAKETLTIGGEAVRTWVVEANLHLLGPKTRGEVFLRLWLAPDYRMTVQEYYDQDIRNENDIPYRGRWTVTLKDLRPRR